MGAGGGVGGVWGVVHYRGTVYIPQKEIEGVGGGGKKRGGGGGGE